MPPAGVEATWLIVVLLRPTVFAVLSLVLGPELSALVVGETKVELEIRVPEVGSVVEIIVNVGLLPEGMPGEEGS